MSKEVRVNVRVSEGLKRRVQKASEDTKISETSFVIACLEALCDYYEERGEITMPLIVKPKSAEYSKSGKPLGETGAFAAIRRVGSKQPPKEKRSSLRDIREVSLGIFSTIPAGWPDHRRVVKPLRTVMVPKGAYPSNAFGLDVSGESMNAATGKLGPVLPGETVVLVPFTCSDEADGKIVAAMIDGHTTLKRLVCPKDGDCYLRPESTNPDFKGKMHPLHDLEVQGVMIGKLESPTAKVFDR